MSVQQLESGVGLVSSRSKEVRVIAVRTSSREGAVEVGRALSTQGFTGSVTFMLNLWMVLSGGLTQSDKVENRIISLICGI